MMEKKVGQVEKNEEIFILEQEGFISVKQANKVNIKF